MNLKGRAACSWLLRASRWYHCASHEFGAYDISTWVNFSWLTIVVISIDRGTWNCYRLLDITLRENDTAARRFMYLNGTMPLGYLQVFRYQRTREMYYCEGCYTSQWNRGTRIVTGPPISAYRIIVYCWSYNSASLEPSYSYRNIAFGTSA